MKRFLVAIMVVGWLVSSCNIPEQQKPVDPTATHDSRPIMHEPKPEVQLPKPAHKPAKPILYKSKTGRITWNKAVGDLLADGWVIHLQRGYEYGILELHEGASGDIITGIMMMPDPDGRRMTIGVYNPNTGQYAVSIVV